MRQAFLGLLLLSLAACSKGGGKLTPGQQEEICMVGKYDPLALATAIGEQNQYGIAMNTVDRCIDRAAMRKAEGQADAEVVAKQIVDSCSTEIDAAVKAEIYRLNHPIPNSLSTDEEAEAETREAFLLSATTAAKFSIMGRCWELTEEYKARKQ